MSWHYRHMSDAFHQASKSKDPNTKVGAVLVDEENGIISTGFNGFPRDVVDSLERLSNRDVKLRLVMHAEANAIYNASRMGTSTNNSSAYITHPPCLSCYGALKQAGIKNIYVPKSSLHLMGKEPWKSDWGLIEEIMVETKLDIVFLDYPPKEHVFSNMSCDDCYGLLCSTCAGCYCPEEKCECYPYLDKEDFEIIPDFMQEKGLLIYEDKKQ